MDFEKLKGIFDSHQELLSLPQTLAEVLRLNRDDRSSAEDLARVLMRDPPLTAKVLRIVNSPFYGVGRQIGSMTQAVVTLGVRQITALALSTSVYKMTDNWGSSFDRIRFWRHSLEVAIAARMIAEKTGSRQAEEAFIAGMLHDIGLLVLESSFPEVFADIWKKATHERDRTELEEETWGTNHAQLGQFLLERWRLPESICQGVGHHHTVFVPGTREPELVFCQIICLANHISHFLLADRTVEETMAGNEQKEILRENLQLDREALHAIQKDLFDKTIAEARYLEVDIGSADDILMEANQLLFDQYTTVEKLLDDNRRMQQQILRDQVKGVSLQSLKLTATTLARYADDAAAAIRQRVEEVTASIESGAIQDPSGQVGRLVEGILGGSATMCFIMDELRRLADSETGISPNEAYFAGIEARIKQQLELITEPVAASD